MPNPPATKPSSGSKNAISSSSGTFTPLGELKSGNAEFGITFELSDGADDLKEQSPRGRAGIDALLQDNEVDTALLQCRGQLQQVLQAAAEPVEFRDHERVAGPQLG
jgi:hypothetical protein